MTETQQTYLIPATNFLRLEEEIAKMNRRAEKLRCEPIKLTVLQVVTKTEKDPVLGFEFERTYHECVVEGESPKLNGWTLVAAIEPLGDEMLVREVPGETCPAEYRQTTLRCDHCGYARRRNAVFVLRHEMGEHKQVGRNCIADFLGHQSPESMLAGAEYLMDFAKLAGEAEDEGWGRRGERCLDILHFVAVVSVLCRKVGWLPKSKSDEFTGPPTAVLAWSIITQPNERWVKELIERKGVVAEERDVKLAEEAIEWGKALDPNDTSSSYLHDLGVCCRAGFVVGRSMGFVASVIAAYQNHLNRLAGKNAAKNAATKRHVGEVEKRVTFQGLRIVFVKCLPDGRYPKTMAKFEDPEGNVLVWFASGSPEWIQTGKVVTIKGTVSKHDHYNGVPQTILKRVELLHEASA